MRFGSAGEPLTWYISQPAKNGPLTCQLCRLPSDVSMKAPLRLPTRTRTPLMIAPCPQHCFRFGEELQRRLGSTAKNRLQTCSAKHQTAEVLHEFLGKAVLPDEKAHVYGAVERIEDQVEIGMAGQFSAIHSALQCGVRFEAAGPDKALSKGFNQLRVTL